MHSEVLGGKRRGGKLVNYSMKIVSSDGYTFNLGISPALLRAHSQLSSVCIRILPVPLIRKRELDNADANMQVLSYRTEDGAINRKQ